MATHQEMDEARRDFENALQRWVRFSREDDEGLFFIQDYAVTVASESMEPGQENMTYMNFIARPNMPGYSVVGLLKSALHYWLGGHNHG